MRVTTATIRQYTLTDDDGRTFEMAFEPAEWIDPKVETNDDGTVTVTYAVHDDDHREYDWNEDELRIFSNGYERDDWIEDNLTMCDMCGFHRDDHNATSRAEWASRGDEGPCETFEPGTVWTDRMFWVERYEHGQVRYALTGESSAVDRQWDVAHACAILTLSDDCEGDREKLTEYARALLDNYTSWCNGDVYGIVSETFAHGTTEDKDAWALVDGTEDSVWGYIGSEYVERAIQSGDF